MDFSAQPQVGTLGPAGKSAAQVSSPQKSAASEENDDHGQRLTVSCDPASGGSFGGAFVRLDSGKGPASFQPTDKLRIDLRNLGDEPVALAIECKVPGNDAAYLTANFTLKPKQGWITAEIPLTKIPAGRSEAFDVLAFVVRAKARFEVGNIRRVRR